jgi:hypothetical protein
MRRGSFVLQHGIVTSWNIPAPPFLVHQWRHYLVMTSITPMTSLHCQGHCAANRKREWKWGGWITIEEQRPSPYVLFVLNTGSAWQEMCVHVTSPWRAFGCILDSSQSYHLNPPRSYLLSLLIIVHVLKHVITIINVCHYISVESCLFICLRWFFVCIKFHGNA